MTQHVLVYGLFLLAIAYLIWLAMRKKKNNKSCGHDCDCP
ncbi:MAG: FeoB-associated Cys-rich membrane protein [Crocinitomicaceae bacterium]|nr:FeoB-associated Cys-rich membrane protein [Crocinitomicaceae bacterium]MBK8925240.1 FeoB-associated Cys-rich membrane protein [Crocinitomicaceae bacterium]